MTESLDGLESHVEVVKAQFAPGIYAWSRPDGHGDVLFDRDEIAHEVVLALAEPLRRGEEFKSLWQWAEQDGKEADSDLREAIEMLESQAKRIEELEAEVERLTVQPGAMPNLLPAGGPSDFSAEPHYRQNRPPQLSDEERERRRGGFSPLDRLGDPLAAAEKRIEELKAALREFGLHKNGCPVMVECSCGLAALLDTEAKP